MRRGKETNWKRHYKLRHNWSRGSCDISEIDVAERLLVPPLLVQMHEGIIVTAESTLGLRAWSIKNDKRLLATAQLWKVQASTSACKIPVSLALNARIVNETTYLDIATGFQDGCFGIYQLEVESESARFSHRYDYSPPSKSPITAIAISDSYLVTLTDLGLLSLYRFQPEQGEVEAKHGTVPFQLVTMLRSHTTWPPSSLSLRSRSQEVVVSIAYALPTFLSGWSVGVQELHLSHDGHIKESRLATAFKQGFLPLSLASSPSSDSSSPSSSDLQGKWQPSLTKPTSLSYNHPYLLAAHSDNTLTLYMVNSSSTDLSISVGSRLWGHTSAVAGAYVGNRGRAVSVNSRGNELRIWELEGGINSAEARRRLVGGDLSVQIRPEQREKDDVAATEAGLRTNLQAMRARTPEPALVSSWVGFDDERVVTLRQQESGRGALVVYDFT